MISGAKKQTLRLPPIPKKYSAFRQWVGAAFRRLAGASEVSLQIDGSEAASTGADGTLRFKVGTGGAAEACIYAWTPTFIRNEDGYDIVTLEPSTCSGVSVITVGSGDIMDFPRPELSIPDTADTTQIVYLKLSSVTETLDDGFVIGAPIGSAEITVSATPLTSTISTTSTIYLELFRWRNGALESQVTKYNVGLYGRGPSGSATYAFPYQGAIA